MKNTTASKRKEIIDKQVRKGTPLVGGPENTNYALINPEVMKK